MWSCGQKGRHNVPEGSWREMGCSPSGFRPGARAGPQPKDQGLNPRTEISFNLGAGKTSITQSRHLVFETVTFALSFFEDTDFS